MRKIILTIYLLATVGCSNRTEKSEAEIRVFKEKWKQESLIESNKDFQYLSLIVSAKTKISKDTTNMILKDYYELNNLAIFKDNSFEIIENNLKHKAIPHKLDLMNTIANKFTNDKTKVYVCYDEIEMHQELKKNSESLDDLYYTSSNLEEKLDEVLDGK